MTSYVTLFQLLRYIANLEQAEAGSKRSIQNPKDSGFEIQRISDAWSVKFIFSLRVTFCLKKTEN